MILVTGGFGFIGSNVARALVADGRRVAVVDNLHMGQKFRNLADVAIDDYWDVDEFEEITERDPGVFDRFEGVVHLGARTDTTQRDGRLLMRLNFRSSRRVLDLCSRRSIPFVYASSAAVYGRSTVFVESRNYERPLNVYGYSKLAFDDHVRSRNAGLRGVVGLRFFNVYGPGETHKGSMASVVAHFTQQLTASGACRLFGASHGFDAGCQRRDFVHVFDVVDVIRWALDVAAQNNPPVIVNVGTGRAETFLKVAELVRAKCPGAIDFIDFPAALDEGYQPYTCADLSELRRLGYGGSFRTVEVGVPCYVEQLQVAGR